MSARESTLELADGRTVGYVEWGAPEAAAVFYCHGFPSSRREILLAQPVVERLGVPARVIAPDRPGYGRSTFHPDRTFLSWPRDVAEIADRLGIDRFAVLGASGGSPYALACAHVLGSRVSRIGIVVGTAPLTAPGMADTPMSRGYAENRLIRHLQFGMMYGAVMVGREARLAERAIATMGDADRLAMERPQVREWFCAVIRDAFAQGGRGAAYEAALYRQPWGFDLAAVGAEAHLWYGGQDRWSPASAGRWLADQLPAATFVLWPQHGHFTWAISEEAAVAVTATAGSGGSP